MQEVRDPNGNGIVFTPDGIHHFSAGSTNADQSIPFIRDELGRGRTRSVLEYGSPLPLWNVATVRDARAVRTF